MFTFTILVYGCSNYSPLYAKRADNITIQKVFMEGNSVSKNVGTRRVAQRVKTHLKRYFPNQTGEYNVIISIRETTSNVAIKRTAITERAALSLRAQLEIHKANSDKSIFNTSVEGTSVYNIENTPYATDAGKSIARQNAANSIASEIVRVIELAKINFDKPE